MKYTWENEDIQAGRFIINNSSSIGDKNKEFARTVVFKIGWLGNQVGLDNWGLCSVLTDGYFIIVGSKEDMCKKLNNENGNEYRYLTKEEFLRLISSTNQGFVDERIRS